MASAYSSSPASHQEYAKAGLDKKKVDSLSSGVQKAGALPDWMMSAYKSLIPSKPPNAEAKGDRSRE